MVWIMFGTLAFILIIIVIMIIIMLKRRRALNVEQKFDVFEVSDNSFTVLAGIPMTYDIDSIQRITLSSQKGLRGNYHMGILRVVRTDGKKSRKFLFDSSTYKKKYVFRNSEHDIEEAIQYLMVEIEKHHITCSRV